MSIKVNDFRWEKGKNDLEYIALLERNHAVMLDNFRKCAKVAKEQYNKGKADAYNKILMYLNDASLSQSGKCYDCTRELIKIIEDMVARDTNVLTKKGSEQNEM